jgi:hypothetical protein
MWEYLRCCVTVTRQYMRSIPCPVPGTWAMPHRLQQSINSSREKLHHSFCKHASGLKTFRRIQGCCLAFRQARFSGAFLIITRELKRANNAVVWPVSSEYPTWVSCVLELVCSYWYPTAQRYPWVKFFSPSTSTNSGELLREMIFP